jgi:hypothetical protein
LYALERVKINDRYLQIQVPRDCLPTAALEREIDCEYGGREAEQIALERTQSANLARKLRLSGYEILPRHEQQIR